MSSDSFKNHMYEDNLALDNQQWLTYYKNPTNQPTNQPTNLISDLE